MKMKYGNAYEKIDFIFHLILNKPFTNLIKLLVSFALFYYITNPYYFIKYYFNYFQKALNLAKMSFDDYEYVPIKS